MADAVCIMGIVREDWPGLHTLANTIYDDGVYFNTTDYSDADPDDATYKPVLTNFNKYYTR